MRIKRRNTAINISLLFESNGIFFVYKLHNYIHSGTECRKSSVNIFLKFVRHHLGILLWKWFHNSYSDSFQRCTKWMILNYWRHYNFSGGRINNCKAWKHFSYINFGKKIQKCFFLIEITYTNKISSKFSVIYFFLHKALLHHFVEMMF